MNSYYNNGILSKIISTILILLSIISLPSFALEEKIIVNGQEYEYAQFTAISGWVVGQAIPGVESISINGKKVPLDSALNFKTEVQLQEGEKNLAIETNHKGLRYYKQYVISRQPNSKPFKINIAQSDFEEIVSRRTPIITHLKINGIKEIASFAADNVGDDKQAAELVKQKKITVKRTTKPQTKTSFQKFMDWFAGMFSSKAEAPKVSQQPTVKKPKPAPKAEKKPAPAPKKETVKIVKQDAQDVLQSEAIKVVAKEAPKIIRAEARAYLEEKVSSDDLFRLMQKQLPGILDKEVKKIIERDVPAGEGLKIVRQEIKQIIQRESPAIIAKETRRQFSQSVSTAEVERLIKQQISGSVKVKLRQNLNESQLWKLAQDTARSEALRIIDQDRLAEIALLAVEEKAKKSASNKELSQLIAATVKNETRKALAQENIKALVQKSIQAEIKDLVALQTPTLVKNEAAKVVKEKEPAPAKAKQPAKITAPAPTAVPRSAAELYGPEIRAVTGQWPYDLIIEIEPGKILLIKEDNGQYLGYIYYEESKLWYPIQDISYKDFKTLLEKGTAQ